jgi:predicted nucleic acid-binding protein
MNVFVDTNVLMDVMVNREPFFGKSARVWYLAETGQVNAAISTITLPNLHYLLRREHGGGFAREAMGILRDLFQLVPFDLKIVNQAVDSDIDDFEDAIQFFSAISAGATTLITRNPKHFPAKDIAVLTPEEFLAANFPE